MKLESQGRDQHIQTLREACIKANPEIVELKFGAKVKLLDYEKYPDAWGIYAGKQFWKSGERDRDLVLHPDAKLYPMDKKYEVIGRPIRLSDVLLAWHSQGEKELREGKIPTPMQGMYGKIAVKWNLRKDDLTEQSDGCVE